MLTAVAASVMAGVLDGEYEANEPLSGDALPGEMERRFDKRRGRWGRAAGEAWDGTALLCLIKSSGLNTDTASGTWASDCRPDAVRCIFAGLGIVYGLKGSMRLA
jgi:hypothetical protein